jgi:hypothetical protein
MGDRKEFAREVERDGDENKGRQGKAVGRWR